MEEGYGEECKYLACLIFYQKISLPKLKRSKHIDLRNPDLRRALSTFPTQRTTPHPASTEPHRGQPHSHTTCSSQHTLLRAATLHLKDQEMPVTAATANVCLLGSAQCFSKLGLLKIPSGAFNDAASTPAPQVLIESMPQTPGWLNAPQNRQAVPFPAPLYSFNKEGLAEKLGLNVPPVLPPGKVQAGGAIHAGFLVPPGLQASDVTGQSTSSTVEFYLSTPPSSLSPTDFSHIQDDCQERHSTKLLYQNEELLCSFSFLLIDSHLQKYPNAVTYVHETSTKTTCISITRQNKNSYREIK